MSKGLASLSVANPDVERKSCGALRSTGKVSKRGRFPRKMKCFRSRGEEIAGGFSTARAQGSFCVELGPKPDSGAPAAPPRKWMRGKGKDLFSRTTGSDQRQQAESGPGCRGRLRCLRDIISFWLRASTVNGLRVNQQESWNYAALSPPSTVARRQVCLASRITCNSANETR